MRGPWGGRKGKWDDGAWGESTGKQGGEGGGGGQG